MRKTGWLREKIDFNSKYSRTSSLRKKKSALLCYTAGGQVIQLYFECFDFWQVWAISGKIKMATECLGLNVSCEFRCKCRSINCYCAASAEVFIEGSSNCKYYYSATASAVEQIQLRVQQQYYYYVTASAVEQIELQVQHEVRVYQGFAWLA